MTTEKDFPAMLAVQQYISLSFNLFLNPVAYWFKRLICEREKLYKTEIYGKLSNEMIIVGLWWLTDKL